MFDIVMLDWMAFGKSIAFSWMVGTLFGSSVMYKQLSVFLPVHGELVS